MLESSFFNFLHFCVYDAISDFVALSNVRKIEPGTRNVYRLKGDSMDNNTSLVSYV